MSARRVIGALIVFAVFAPWLTLVAPYVPARPDFFVRFFEIQVWLIYAARAVYACAAIAFCFLTTDRPARLLFALSGTLNVVLAAYGILKIMSADSPFGVAVAGFGYVSLLLMAAGLWRSRFVPRWIPLLATSGVAITIAATSLIPQSVIYASAQSQAEADFAVNWWAMPSAVGALMINLAWLAVGVSLLWPGKPEAAQAV